MSENLVVLKMRVRDAKERLDYWRAANYSGLSAQEEVEIDLALRRAQKAYLEAVGEYETAVEVEVGGRKPPLPPPGPTTYTLRKGSVKTHEE